MKFPRFLSLLKKEGYFSIHFQSKQSSVFCLDSVQHEKIIQSQIAIDFFYYLIFFAPIQLFLLGKTWEFMRIYSALPYARHHKDRTGFAIFPVISLCFVCGGHPSESDKVLVSVCTSGFFYFLLTISK